MAKSNQSNKKPGQSNGTDNSRFYTRLIIFRARQLSLAMMVTVFLVIFTSMIFNDLLNNAHWFAIATPLILLGMVFLLFPGTEEWEYRAWQTRVEQIERHFLD